MAATVSVTSLRSPIAFDTLRPLYRGKRRISVSGVVEQLSDRRTTPVCYLQIGDLGALIRSPEPIGPVGRSNFSVTGTAVFPHRHPWTESEDIYCRAAE